MLMLILRRIFTIIKITLHLGPYELRLCIHDLTSSALQVKTLRLREMQWLI